MSRRAVGLWAVVAVLAVLVVGITAARERPPGISAVVAASPDAGRTALLAEVRRELVEMRDTGYQHRTAVAAREGGYYFDCSGFVDYALAHSRPANLDALPVTRSTRPLAADFVRHFRAVAAGTAGGPWEPVGTVPELRPGDVIAWLRPAEVKSRNTGHVLVVLETPVANPNRPGEWLVKAADSTTSPHAEDSREKSDDGLGTGTIGLSADTAGRPVGYYWRGGVSTVLRHTEIALGRPG
ncbi:hypothetical protein GCM10023321_39830 [Pseudonocardia eucalypti]|uniref:NlpC/P60 domain-containing protein n=1 Tax=Pseudonocardia eucalypti TaxID=648755 RepID=A0ABP9QBW3_9PSEU|nr:hypothetical protein [Pseudonocardia eucalypti]